MAGNKRTTRSKAALAKRPPSPVEGKVHVLTKQQFSRLNSAVVKEYAVRNGLDPNMARKEIAAVLFGADDTILAGHKMNWSTPWTPQNAPASLPAGPSNAGSNAAHELDVEGSNRRLRNGEISDPAEQHAVKSELISAALLTSIGKTNAAARRMLNGSTGVGEGSQTQPLVVDTDSPHVDHAFATQTTSSGARPRLSAASQESYPSPAVSALASPTLAPLVESQLLSNDSLRQHTSHAPIQSSRLGGKRTRDDDDESGDNDCMREGESEDGPTERPAKQQRLASASGAPQESANADRNHATSSPPPSSPRLTAVQKGKGKVASPPSPRSPVRELAAPTPEPVATINAQPPPANVATTDEAVDLQQNINAAPTATPAQSPSSVPSAAPGLSGPSRAPALARTRNVFSQPDRATYTMRDAQDMLNRAYERNRDSRDFLAQVNFQQQKITELEDEAKAIVEGARSQLEHARVILGHEKVKRGKGREKVDRLIRRAVVRDMGSADWDDEEMSDDELEPTDLLTEAARAQENLYTRCNEELRYMTEWWHKRMEWKALHRANKKLLEDNPRAVLYTTKDVPRLIQAQRERALRVVQAAKRRRDARIQLERTNRGEEHADRPVDGNEPFEPIDFEGVEENEDAEDNEGDGWLVWDWFTSPELSMPRLWQPFLAGMTGKTDKLYFAVY